MGSSTPVPASPVLLFEGDDGRTLRFRDPAAVLRADGLDAVPAVLAQVAEAVGAGFHVAGYAAYEAGYAFEPRLRGLAPPPSGPLLRFGVFQAPEQFDWAGVGDEGAITGLEPAWGAADYARRFDRVAEHIRAGDVYQVNLTFPLRGRWRGDPLALYAALRRHQPTALGAFADWGDEATLSFSPELFFATEGGTVRVRPMKGTAPRGGTPAADEALARDLAAGEKTRAENLMIVDLLRNDLGRIAAIGSVRVTDLFSVERHPTVLQMTSGIEARLRPEVGWPALFGSLFPCGSVTGAPKIKAMEIIHALEEGPRGVYCGALGYIRPDGASRFSVAIRTATLTPDGACVFPVGSGVVFDSDMRAEYEECLLKSRFLAPVIRPSG